MHIQVFLVIVCVITSCMSTSSYSGHHQENNIGECIRINDGYTETILNATLLHNLHTNLVHVPPKTTFLPEAPTSIALDVLNHTLHWQMKGWRRVEYFLLETEYLGVINGKIRHKVQYALVNVSHMVNMLAPFSSVSFTCINIEQHTSHVKGRLWVLGDDVILDSNSSVITAAVNEYSSASFQRGGIEDEMKRHMAEQCICHTNYTISFKHVWNETSRMVVIERLHSFNYPVDLKVQLVRNGSKVSSFSKHSFTTGQKQLEVLVGRLRSGRYSVNLTPECNSGFFVSCGRSNAFIVESSSSFRVGPALHQQGLYSYPRETNHRDPYTSPVTIVMLVIFATVFATAEVIAVAVMIRAILNPKKQKKRYLPLHAKRTLIGRTKAAIIYTPDSDLHQRRVLALQRCLWKHGVDADLYGDDAGMAMYQNWIDLAERIVVTYPAVFIVSSPKLIAMCDSNACTKPGQQEPACLQGHGMCAVGEVKHETMEVKQHELESMESLETDMTEMEMSENDATKSDINLELSKDIIKQIDGNKFALKERNHNWQHVLSIDNDIELDEENIKGHDDVMNYLDNGFKTSETRKMKDFHSDPIISPPHLLPLVVIHSLKAARVCQWKRSPSVINVTFSKHKHTVVSKTADRLQQEHPSIAQHKSVSVRFDQSTIVNEWKLQRVARKLHKKASRRKTKTCLSS